MVVADLTATAQYHIRTEEVAWQAWAGALIFSPATIRCRIMTCWRSANFGLDMNVLLV